MIAEAELAVRGIHPVSVVHGDAVDQETDNLIHRVLPRLAREAGTLAGTQGGNDYTTYLFAGPDAQQAAVRFIAAASEEAESWWKITPTAQPKFR
ncbi:hypothetical protein GCM10023196_036280 [Actinoallomurus vinaceus]|uniref:GHMP kinase C-terminal domain-containing protein n=1 Tax=Actinoallomurus vinaceus TaxID=1080074 RepID=A0ABP8UB05_9ACTN